MNYQNSIKYVAQPCMDLGVSQQLQRRKVLELAGGQAFWRGLSKIALAVTVVVLCLNVWLGFSVRSIERTLQEVETTRHQLKDEQIVLLAERARLMSKKQVREKAGAELALFVPSEDQVYKLR